MPTSLKDIQSQMQAAILHGDDEILAHIKQSSKEQRETLLNIYQHAYGARLQEFLENDYPLTRTYLGEELFAQTAKAYVNNTPSSTPNARWFGQNFPEHCASDPTLKDQTEIAELAHLERALNTAFDATDTPSFSQNNLAEIPPEQWGDLTFQKHPSVSRLTHITNAADIWSALSKEETPPPAKPTQKMTELIIWRGERKARFRPLAYDEAMIWDEAMKGAGFADLCEMLGTYWTPEEAPLKAASYLQGWLQAEWLAVPEKPS